MLPYQSSRHLPGDLLPEILCRLPVKSLLRFRCVSKPWLALVDNDAECARLHLKTFKHNSGQTRVVFVNNGDDGKLECEVRCSDTFEPITDKIPPSEARKLVNWMAFDFVDGLILLRPTTTTDDECFDISELRVWNPSTRKLLEIPPTPGLPTSSLGYNERYFGFGYDPIAKYYKLVKLIFLKDSLDSVAIYTFGAGTWKTIKFHHFHGNGSSACFDWHWLIFPYDKAVYFRSCLYFVMLNKLQDRGCDLVWFDLSKEVFSSVTIPASSYFGSVDWNRVWWTLVSVEGGIIVQAPYGNSTYTYEWAVDSMCWNKPQLYSLNGGHIKKNGDMLVWRFNSKKLPDESVGWDLWIEVGSYSSEREEHKMELDAGTGTTDVYLYVESLILNRLMLLNL